MKQSDGFETTKWSMILAAREDSDPRSREALASLCESYWYPLYVFVRRQGHGADDAFDLTQGYFLTLLEKDALKAVRREAGRFRSFLLASIKHFMAHERDRERALKRGGGKQPLSLDAAAAEERYGREPADDETPERAYERRWALTVLDRVRRRLGGEFASEGKSDEFHLLSPFLTGDRPGRPYSVVAERLGTSEAAVKMGVMRLRRRFGTLLREEIAQTVREEADIDDEIRHLLETVRSG